MQIRDFRESDYNQVYSLLVECEVDPPEEPGDLAGPCIVAEDEGQIVGVLFALAGASTRAYLDYLAVKEEYRGRFLYYRLLKAIESKLKAMGVKRYMFHIEKWNSQQIAQCYKYRKKYQITRLNDLHYFSREIPQGGAR